MNCKLAATYIPVTKAPFHSVYFICDCSFFHGNRSFPHSQNLWLSLRLSPNKSHLHGKPLESCAHEDTSLILLKYGPILTKVCIKRSVPVALSTYPRNPSPGPDCCP